MTTLDEADARRLTMRINLTLGSIADARDKVLPLIREAKEGAAHDALGYASWSAYVAAEFAETLPRLTRDERQPIVAELAALGMSTRAIAPVVGASRPTVARDLATVSDETDEPRIVESLDGRTRTYTPTPKPDPADLVAEFPELDHYADRPADLVRIGTALRGYAEPERAMRRQALAATIAAEQRRATEPPAAEQEEPDLADLAMAIFMACNAAARTIARSGGTDTVNAALPAYTPAEVDNWRGQFESLASTCHDLASACRPGLRRVK